MSTKGEMNLDSSPHPVNLPWITLYVGWPDHLVCVVGMFRSSNSTLLRKLIEVCMHSADARTRSLRRMPREEPSMRLHFESQRILRKTCPGQHEKVLAGACCET